MKKIYIIAILSFQIFTFPLFATDLLKSDVNLDGRIDFYDLSDLSAEWLKNGLPVAPVTNTFPGPAELRCKQTQRNSVPAGQWKTIINLNDGPCLVTNFWMATDFLYSVRNTPIRIYFDDHDEPDIEGETGGIFACGYNEKANFRGDFVGVSNSQDVNEHLAGYEGFAGYLRLPMPYYESIRIDIKNPTTSNRNCWMMLERMPIDPNYLHNIGLQPGMYLKTTGYGDANNYSEYSEITLLDTNQPTILAGVFQFFDNSTGAGGNNNFSYLEGDYRIYYGGSKTASYRASGTEDFYHSSYYFQEGPLDHMDECLVLKNESNFNLAASRFFPLERAPYHKNGIKFTWTLGDPGLFDPGDTYLRWIVWYYQ